MKTLLLYKSTEDADSEQRVMPNGLMWLTAYLKDKGFDISARNLSNKDWDYAKRVILEEKPDIVGISCFSFNRRACVELARIVKLASKDTIVVFGGPHATLMAEQMLANYPQIDFIVKGEAELVMEDLLQHIKEDKDTGNVKGLFMRKDNKVVFSGDQELIADLDRLPLPARHFRYNQIITARGCPADCIYCATPKLCGRKVRFRSAKHVVDEIEMLHKKYKISYFFLSDDTFNIKKEHLISICDEIIKRKLQIVWNCMLRVDMVSREMFESMKKAGCVSVFFGIESGSPEILKTLNKGITREQVKEACRLAREFGFEIQTYFIVGSPGESSSTIEETRNLISEIRPMAVTTTLMTLYPGTGLYERARESGFISDDFWLSEEPERIYTKDHSLEQLEKFKRDIERHYMQNRNNYSYTPAEINNNIKRFSSPMEYHYLGLALQQRGEQKKAIIAFSIAVTKNPGFVPGYVNMGLLAMQQKKFTEAARLFEVALQKDPFENRVYTYLGDSYTRMGRVDDAVKIFEAAKHRNPRNISILNRLGAAYGIINKHEKALREFEGVLAIDPKNKAAKRNIEFTRIRMGREKA